MPARRLRDGSSHGYRGHRSGSGRPARSINCPNGHSPSHVELDPVWATAQEAAVPIVFHVGGGGEVINPDYLKNGKPSLTDFMGGAESFRSVDYMSIPGSPMQTLTTMIIDGVLERFPRLKIGVIEQGAVWIPGWMRQMDAADGCGLRGVPPSRGPLASTESPPMEYVQRQIRATPYPTEDVGWIISQGCEDIVLFSSDYPPSRVAVDRSSDSRGPWVTPPRPIVTSSSPPTWST